MIWYIVWPLHLILKSLFFAILWVKVWRMTKTPLTSSKSLHCKHGQLLVYSFKLSYYNEYKSYLRNETFTLSEACTGLWLKWYKCWQKTTKDSYPSIQPILPIQKHLWEYPSPNWEHCGKTVQVSYQCRTHTWLPNN